MHFKRVASLAWWQACSVVLFLSSMQASAQTDGSACGPLRSQGQYGPYDYRSERPRLVIVEGVHFVPAIEELFRSDAGSNIDYTLRASPNHHRALLAMVRLGEKQRSNKPAGATYSLDCYFERAVRFANDDAVVKMIHATYLAKTGRNPEAIQQLERATAQAGDSPFSHYNIGLVYFDLKQYDKALQQAHKAIALEFPRTELQEQLKSAGKWVDPPDRSAVKPDADAKSDAATPATPAAKDNPPGAISN